MAIELKGNDTSTYSDDVTITGDLSSTRGLFSNRARAVSGNSYSEISHADGVQVINENITTARIAMNGSIEGSLLTVDRDISAASTTLVVEDRGTRGVQIFGNGTTHIGGTLSGNVADDSPNITLNADGTSLFAKGLTTEGGIFRAGGPNCGIIFYGTASGSTVAPSDGTGSSRGNAVNLGDPANKWKAVYATTSNIQRLNLEIGADDPANFNTEGEYTGPTLNVGERVQNLIARLDALEANEIIDDSTDTALLQLLANASARLDNIEARLTALEGN